MKTSVFILLRYTQDLFFKQFAPDPAYRERGIAFLKIKS